jgi:hypothetical protein
MGAELVGAILHLGDGGEAAVTTMNRSDIVTNESEKGPAPPAPVTLARNCDFGDDDIGGCGRRKVCVLRLTAADAAVLVRASRLADWAPADLSVAAVILHWALAVVHSGRVAESGPWDDVWHVVPAFDDPDESEGCDSVEVAPHGAWAEWRDDDMAHTVRLPRFEILEAVALGRPPELPASRVEMGTFEFDDMEDDDDEE